MAIVSMKRLRLFGLNQDRDSLFEKLQRLGCVEISQQSDRLQDPEWADLTHPNQSIRSEKERLLEETTAALSVLDQYAPVKTPMLAPKRQVGLDALFDEATLTAALESAREINDYADKLTENAAASHKLSTTIASLLPWSSLDTPLNTQSTASVYVAFGMLPASTDLEAVKKDLTLNADASELEVASSDTEMHYVLFYCHKSVEEAALDVLKSYGFSTTGFKGITGTASETIRYLNSEQAVLQEQAESLKESLSAYGSSREALQLCADRMTQEIQKEACKERLLDTDKTFFLEGWFTAPDEAALTALLGSYDCAYEIAEPDEEDYPAVPVKLKNNRLTEPLNNITETYSLPAYGTVDPNPLMAPFFILFYGMMMADMGYGLLMFFCCWFVVKKKRLKGSGAHLFNLIKYCGITTFIFGAMTGSFFGDLVPQLTAMLAGGTAEDYAWPCLFTTLSKPLEILIGSLVLGLIQIFTGMGVSIYMKWKRGQKMDALMNECVWYVVFILLGVAYLASAWKVCLIAIVVLLVLTQGYGKKGIVGKLTGIGGSLYNNLTGYFSDILSYSRLMALMLAGAVIAQVFNTLASLTGNVVTFFIVAIIGNALNMALNLLGCYVHDLRLQCLEFFSRFYEDGGKKFEPVSINTNYVDVIQ